MGFFSNLSKNFDNVMNGAKALAGRHLGPDYLKACAYVGAGIAAADGSVDDSEIKVLVGVMGGMEELSGYDESEILNAVSEAVGKWKIAAAIGNIETERLLKSLDGDQRQYALAIGAAVAAADGDFDDDEKAVLRGFAEKVGVNPADLGC